LGIGDGLTLQMDNGSVRAIRSYSNIQFSQLPGGLNTRPTLVWLLDSPSSGTQKTRIAYETQGVTWWADYNIILDESTGCNMDLSAWVSIINQSGASYGNARLKLIAGDVNRAQPVLQQSEMMFKSAAMADSAGFSEKAFFEYHLYTLGRRTDLPDNSTKQLELLPSTAGVACNKELVFAPTLANPYSGYSQLEQEYEREPTADEIAFLLDIGTDEVAATLGASARHVSMDQPFSEGEDGSLVDVLVNPNAEAADLQMVFHDSLSEEINRSLNTLTDRQKEVVRYFFGIGVDHALSLEDIGERYNLTRERVRQIKDKAITKLRSVSRCKLLRPYLGA